MKKWFFPAAVAALLTSACTDSTVGPDERLTPAPGGTTTFDIIAGEFNIATSVVDSYQGSRMFIPGGVGYTKVMDGGAANDGTYGSGEPDRSTAASVLSLLNANWFSLGLNVGPATEEGYVVVDFGLPQGGKAAVVWEETFNTAGYPLEQAKVYGSNDWTDAASWVYLGTAGNKGPDDPNCESADPSNCTYTVLDEVDQCFQFVKVVNATAPTDYDALSYVTGGQVNAAPGAGAYPGNDLIPDGFDVQAIAFESTCELGGCTLTQGYWKNHPDDWADLANDPFFQTGWTWLQVLKTPPAKGNSYLILAHQYIAAYLSVNVNGATAPAGLAQAEALLDGPTGEPFVKDGSWNALASALDSFVNDNHCSEESEDIL